jgi:hypothetical protein
MIPDEMKKGLSKYFWCETRNRFKNRNQKLDFTAQDSLYNVLY